MKPIRKQNAIVCAALIGLLLLAACGGGGGGGGGVPIAEGGSTPQCSTSSVVHTVLPGPDPLFGQMWHLVNTGQFAFASANGISGEDIKNTTVATGFGVKIAIVDTGMEIGHEDLAPNENGGSWNFLTGTNDPTNTNECNGDHGTSVAGLAAAADGNGLGGQGVAPDAELGGFNFLSAQSTANQTDSLGGARSLTFDVFNQSYGVNTENDFPVDAILEAHLKDRVDNGRMVASVARGQIFVKSAGNGFNGYGVFRSGSFASAFCGDANAAGLSCQNANMDPSNALPWNIVVGAVNAEGKRASYSTAGSALLVSAPGGEFGFHSSFKPGFVAVAYEPAMITTDQSGCGKGYSHTNFDPPGTGFPGNPPPNDFEDDHPLDPDCNYTSTFNGTSSAAPVLTGVIAQMLDANPNLTWRDVRHILVVTADNTLSTTDNIGNSTPTTITGLTGGPYEAEPGWTPNLSGLTNPVTSDAVRFHNWFGFGRVHATNAVNTANSYLPSPNPWPTLVPFTGPGSSPNAPIPDASATGVTDTITVATSGITFIEAVQISVNVTHTFTGDLAIELTSPSGTKSILLTTRNGFSFTDNLANMVLLSNAFYGENPETPTGDWTIRLVDTVSGFTGTLNSWNIIIHGH